MNYLIEDLIQLLASEQAEAIHLHDGEAPLIEDERWPQRIEGPRLETGEPEAMYQTIAPPDEMEEIRRNGASECAYQRFGAAVRVMAFLEQGNVQVEIRRLKFDPTLRHKRSMLV